MYIIFQIDVYSIPQREVNQLIGNAQHKNAAENDNWSVIAATAASDNNSWRQRTTLLLTTDPT